MKADFDVTLRGFDDREIDRLLADIDSTGNPGLSDEDAVPAPSGDPATRRASLSHDGAVSDRGGGLESGAGDAGRLIKARAANEVIKAMLGELRLRERTGELVSRAQAVQVYQEALAAARAAIEGMPTRLAWRLVGLKAVAIRAALQAEVDGVLRGLSNGLDAAR